MISAAQVGPDLGKALDSSVIESGLRELNVDINFDIAVRRSDFAYCMEMDPRKRRAVENGRQPVCHLDRYICAMDRGMVPEFKVWSVREAAVQIEWADADQEGASIQYQNIPTADPAYVDLWHEAIGGRDPGLKIMDNGSLVRMTPYVVRKVRGRILQVGWRYTFIKLIRANIPGVTAVSIGAKFGVDMLKYPMGAPEEVRAALMEE